MKTIRILLLSLLLMLYNVSYAQTHTDEPEKTSSNLFHDPETGALDISNWLIDANGFVPVINFVTEPALGGFGMTASPMFLKQRESATGQIQPDITVAGGMYSLNNSWMLFAAHIGTIDKWGIKYRVGMSYMDVNLDYMRELPKLNQQLNFSANLQGVPIFLRLMKNIPNTDIYAGLSYNFANFKVTPELNGNNFVADHINNYIQSKDLNSTISALGVILEIDKRNTIFTADRGYNFNTMYTFNDSWTGSDYTFSKYQATLYGFIPVNRWWISGWRADYQIMFGDAPFYGLPFVDMRGVPKSYYQGDATYVAETEQRFDVTSRWSVLAFGGLGKGVSKDIGFKDSQLVYSYGSGFRYLLSKAFGMRVGIDVAKSNNDWGWYITFGHAWNR